MAVDLDAVVYASDEDLVDVEDLGERLRGSAKADFDLAVALE